MVDILGIEKKLSAEAFGNSVQSHVYCKGLVKNIIKLVPLAIPKSNAPEPFDL